MQIPGRGRLLDVQDQVSIGDVLQDPGFDWDYTKFMAKLQSDHSYSNEPTRWIPRDVTVSDRHEQLSCEDLRIVFSEKMIRISTTEYFAPLLMVNPFYSAMIGDQLGMQAFEILFNFLVRPVPNVFTAIRKFKERYFSGHHVVSMYIQLHDESDGTTLSEEYRRLYFDTAAVILNEEAQEPEHDNSAGAMLFVVTDDQPTLLRELQLMRHRAAFGAAGVVAITSISSPMLNPSAQRLSATSLLPIHGYDRELLVTDEAQPFFDAELEPLSELVRVQTELQQLWLLG